ncbi:MAG: hypothetical protein LBB79_01695 [Prevotellaceae bacterium]|nr:hypothetical protein [Prevotellaceae bacterium]
MPKTEGQKNRLRRAAGQRSKGGGGGGGAMGGAGGNGGWGGGRVANRPYATQTPPPICRDRFAAADLPLPLAPSKSRRNSA